MAFLQYILQRVGLCYKDSQQEKEYSLYKVPITRNLSIVSVSYIKIPHPFIFEVNYSKLLNRLLL